MVYGYYGSLMHAIRVNTKKGMFFYIVQYPVRWTAQSALPFTPGRPVNSGSDLNSLGATYSFRPKKIIVSGHINILN